MSKRDVARYMEKQRKEAAEPVNNTFAQAWRGSVWTGRSNGTLLRKRNVRIVRLAADFPPVLQWVHG